MNDFIEQFLIESREQIEQATAELLALEETPADKARLDGAFRAFHTLKGGAGIVDFTAMAKAVHAAEDALSSARSGARGITAVLIGDCLTCLDQLARWLDATERAGDFPKDAEAQASVIVARFARSAGETLVALPESRSVPKKWAEVLRAKYATLGARAQTAIRYVPDASCFYEGLDPLARIAALPGVLAVSVEPASPWPPLDALDPFTCNLVLSALTTSSRTDVIGSMGSAAGQCDIDESRDEEGSGGELLPPAAREVLEEQLLLLGETRVHGSTGRMASAGVVAANVLRSARRAAAANRISDATEAALAEGEPRFLKEAIETVLGKASLSEVAAPFSPATHQQMVRQTLRIDAARIDAIVNLTGELTVAKNSIGHVAKLAQEGGNALASILKDRHAALDHLVSELQRSVLAMRVVPLDTVFQRFPRMLREISSDLGKPARLVVEGGETEADKAIVEMLFEPLLHVLRNALAHGVENDSTRAARHKPAIATIRMRAGRQGEHVLVEVSDDGGGIDVARIHQAALARNLVDEATLVAMSDDEAIEMIFEPGFSTAREVTGLSGRGVGLDAVRTAVERLAGRVSVESRAGEGTTVRFTLPYSVMLTRVMVVDAGEQTFGIPLDAVVETLRVDANRIAPIGAAHAIVLRDRTIPLVALAGALGLHREERPAAEATIVVTKLNGHYGALRVDRIGERMEVMLKPLDGLLAGMRGLAGSTLLGDGSVLLVLDLGELFQ